MNESVARAISKSSEDFLKLAWPVIGQSFGDLVPVETVTDNDFAAELDRRAGIDVWLVGVDGHMRGLASRVQWGIRRAGQLVDGSYDTFTIRIRSRLGLPTEYHKRKSEIVAAGATIRPHYVAQAYISLDRSRLIAAGIARMADVIAAIDNGWDRPLPPNGDGTQGTAVDWSRLRAAGAPIRTWPMEQEQIPMGDVA